MACEEVREGESAGSPWVWWGPRVGANGDARRGRARPATHRRDIRGRECDNTSTRIPPVQYDSAEWELAKWEPSWNLPQFPSEKWELSCLGFVVALTVCFTYPVLYRVSAESRAGEWEL